MTQQLSKNIHSAILPARSELVVENPVPKSVCVEKGSYANSNPGTGTLRYHIEQFAKGHKCICPKRFVIPVRAYNTDYVEQTCKICANVFGRIYD